MVLYPKLRIKAKTHHFISLDHYIWDCQPSGGWCCYTCNISAHVFNLTYCSTENRHFSKIRIWNE